MLYTIYLIIFDVLYVMMLLYVFMIIINILIC